MLRTWILAGNLFAGCVSASMMAAEPPLSSGDESAVLKRILANWQARESLFKSCSFAWDSRTTPAIVAGAKVSDRGELWMQGADKLRLLKVFDKSGRDLPKTNEPLSVDHVWAYAFDGSTSRELTADVDFADGIIDRGTGERNIDRGSHFPLILALRPSRGGLGGSAWRWHVVTQNAIVNGTHCVKIERTAPGIAETDWVDPARGDIIVACEQPRDDSRRRSFASIEYQHDPKYGWIPSRWTQSIITAPKVYQGESAVTKYAINDELGAVTFTLNFPSRTAVVDRAHLETYVVARDGSKADVVKFDSLLSLELHEGALQQTVDFSIEEEPLSDALQFIAQRYQIKVAIDVRAVRQGLIDPTIKVRVGVSGIKLRSCLNLLLKQSRKPLAYEIRQGALVIVPATGPK